MFLKSCLDAFNNSVKKRDKWYSVNLEPGNKYFIDKKKELWIKEKKLWMNMKFI